MREQTRERVMRRRICACLVATTVGLMACGDGGKAAAEAALRALETAYDSVKREAAEYAPDQAKRIDEALADAQETFSKQEYKKTLSDAQGLMAKVGELGAAVATKKTELTRAWEGVRAGVPGVVQSLQHRVEELSKVKKLPSGVKKETVEAAKSGAAALSHTWDEATEAFKSANLTDAVAKAKTVKAKAAELFTSIGQRVPDELK
jgi:hypothetical protein